MWDRYTAVCTNVPTKDVLSSLIVNAVGGGPANITLLLGFTFVHPKDQYSRKIGRQKALKNIESIDFHIDGVHFNTDTIDVDLRSQKKDINLILQIKKERPYVYLTSVNL
jgi:hypothetical protein